jgi:peptidylprolyl isomerase
MKSAAFAAACGAFLIASPSLAAKKAPPAAATPPGEADWRTPDPQNVLVIETNKGRIIAELNPTAAPATVAQVRALAHTGVYDARAFFRVIDNFMDQTGDPMDSGVGASALPNLKAEFTFRRGPDTPFVRIDRRGSDEEGFVGSLPVLSQPTDLGLLTADHKVEAWGEYCPGVLGMARSDDPDSGNSQFFLMRNNMGEPDHGTHQLDKKYTAFGRALVGQDVVDQIKTGEPVAAPQDKMLTVKLLADLPEAERPKIRVIDAASAWFKADIERQRAKAGSDFNLCRAELPVEVK